MKVFGAFLFLIWTFAASAMEPPEISLTGGLRYNTAQTDLKSASIHSKLGFLAGVQLNLPLARNWGLRTGAIYNQRYVDLGPVKEGDVETRFSYFDVPLTTQVHFTDFFSLFAGPLLAFNQSQEVSCSLEPKCTARNIRSIVVPFQVGAHFRLRNSFGAEVFYEYILGELATNIMDMQSGGANLIYFFE